MCCIPSFFWNPHYVYLLKPGLILEINKTKIHRADANHLGFQFANNKIGGIDLPIGIIMIIILVILEL